MRILSLIVVLALSTVSPTPLPLHAQTDARAAAWVADIDRLVAALKETHPRFQSCRLPAELSDQVSALAAHVASTSDEQIVVALQRLLASVGDGHTLTFPFGMARGSLLRAPVMLWAFDDGLYVIDAADQSLVGKRVTRIGSLGADDVLGKLAAYVSHDNEFQLRWAAPFYATLTDFLVAVGASTDRREIAIRLDDGRWHTLHATPIDPERLEIKLVAPRTGRIPPWLAHRDERFRVERIDQHLLYVGVNAIDDSPNETLADFGRRLRSPLDSATALILDLRLNNGGEALKADELLKTLIAFDTRGGKLAVLTSRMTFSAAQTLATRLDQWTNAIFIGEPTGSSPNHYGNERPFKLPYSGLRGTVASGLNQPVTARDKRTSITPDLVIGLRSSDYFAGRDPVLDSAIARMRSGK